MKKQSIILIAIVVVILSWLSEVALSMIGEEKWSNYIHSWETKRSARLKKTLIVNSQEPVIVFCGTGDFFKEHTDGNA
jgi:hypothetical protein